MGDEMTQPRLEHQRLIQGAGGNVFLAASLLQSFQQPSGVDEPEESAQNLFI
jgi:hypothetical protein